MQWLQKRHELVSDCWAFLLTVISVIVSWWINL